MVRLEQIREEQRKIEEEAQEQAKLDERKQKQTETLKPVHAIPAAEVPREAKVVQSVSPIKATTHAGAMMVDLHRHLGPRSSASHAAE